MNTILEVRNLSKVFGGGSKATVRAVDDVSLSIEEGSTFGLLGEYVVSAVNVRAAAAGPKTELRNKAWQLAGGYVLTGEHSAFGGVVPATNFDPAAGTWGAFEVVARYAQLDVDDNAFPTLAAASTSADAAKSAAVGVNWYLSKAVRASFDYYHTRFTLPAGAPAVSSTPFLRQNEQAFITRFQLTFCPEPNAVSVL